MGSAFICVAHADANHLRMFRILDRSFVINTPLPALDAPTLIHENTITPGEQLVVRVIRERGQIHTGVESALLSAGCVVRRPPCSRRPQFRGGDDKSREFFVRRELAEKVIEALPDAQWRLMFALARFGGLRCPSEVLSLRWGDIDWDRNRIVITSPKTEHHEGGASRVIPLFPELRQYLDECFQIADEVAEYCVSRYRKFDSNYSVLLNKLVKRAGLPTWPKPWHNLRSSRETELVEQYPEHVVCKWIGNSPRVAKKHYLQVTDEHFEKAVQKAVQQPAEMARKASQPSLTRPHAALDLQGIARLRDLLRELRVGDEGLELDPFFTEDSHIPGQRAAKSGADAAQTHHELISLLVACITQPELVGNAISQLVAGCRSMKSIEG